MKDQPSSCMRSAWIPAQKPDRPFPDVIFEESSCGSGNHSQLGPRQLTTQLHSLPFSVALLWLDHWALVVAASSRQLWFGQWRFRRLQLSAYRPLSLTMSLSTRAMLGSTSERRLSRVWVLESRVPRSTLCFSHLFWHTASTYPLA